MKLWAPKRKCPKAIPRPFQNHVGWSRALKSSVKSYVTGTSAKCYFNEFLFMQGPHTWLNIINQRLWDFWVSWSPGCLSGVPSRGIFENSPSDHEIRSIWCDVGIHVDFTSTHFVGPSSVLWSKLGPAPPFPPMRVLEVQRSQALSFVCEVALSRL